MGFLSKAFKKVKPASMARQASGKMGKGLFGKVASRAVSESKKSIRREQECRHQAEFLAHCED
jgi:hypothetical protein